MELPNHVAFGGGVWFLQNCHEVYEEDRQWLWSEEGQPNVEADQQKLKTKVAPSAATVEGELDEGHGAARGLDGEEGGEAGGDGGDLPDPQGPAGGQQDLSPGAHGEERVQQVWDGSSEAGSKVLWVEIRFQSSSWVPHQVFT